MKNLPTFEKFLNEATISKEAVDTYNSAIELDAPAMEDFLLMLSDYFKDNASSLTNMDAKKIAGLLKNAHIVVKQRSGN
jgi:hypothetical protein